LAPIPAPAIVPIRPGESVPRGCGPRLSPILPARRVFNRGTEMMRVRTRTAALTVAALLAGLTAVDAQQPPPTPAPPLKVLTFVDHGTVPQTTSAEPGFWARWAEMLCEPSQVVLEARWMQLPP